MKVQLKKMNYKYRILLEESLTEIIRNRLNLILSILVLTVLSTIYFLSLSYSYSVFNSQKSFYANNPIYAILSDDVVDTDISFIKKTFKEKFQTSNIRLIGEDEIGKGFWKELGVSKTELSALGFKIPSIVRISYENAVSVLSVSSTIRDLSKSSNFVKTFVYDDQGFKTSIGLWEKTKSHALFYIFSSLFSLVFFIFILLCFLGLNKKENLRILNYLGASDQFALVPLFIYSLISFIISGLCGLILSSQMRGIFNINSVNGINYILFLSYISLFCVCYLTFPFFISRIIQDENS